MVKNKTFLKGKQNSKRLKFKQKNKSKQQDHKLSKKQIDKFKSYIGLTNEEIVRLKNIEKTKSLEIENEKSLEDKHKGQKGWDCKDIVVFKVPPNKKKTNDDSKKINLIEDKSNDNGLDINVTRREVHAFAIKGFDKDKQQNVRIQNLIKLGAKPPKNKFINYKELIEERKTKKEESKKQNEIDKIFGYKLSSINSMQVSRSRKKTKKDRNDVGPLNGQIGKHYKGVTKLNLKQIKSNKSFNKKEKFSGKKSKP